MLALTRTIKLKFVSIFSGIQFFYSTPQSKLPPSIQSTPWNRLGLWESKLNSLYSICNKPASLVKLKISWELLHNRVLWNFNHSTSSLMPENHHKPVLCNTLTLWAPVDSGNLRWQCTLCIKVVKATNLKNFLISFLYYLHLVNKV